MHIPKSRKVSFIFIVVIYVLAGALGIITYLMTISHMSDIWALFLADVVATIFTWLMGLLYKNVSVYDPYWSVAPPVILTAYAYCVPKVSVSAIVMVIVVWIWAIRLTINWAVTFKGLRYEDWRYTKYRTEKSAWIFHVINFSGLNMMPTIVVFLAMMPAIYLLKFAPEVTIWTWIGALMCVIATTIQLIADTTAHQFRREHKGEICKVGLWKNGRHPNYFGEILMWWGVWVQWAGYSLDWLIVGAIVISALFLGISIPLMESRQMKNKPGYEQYRKETRILI